MLKFFFTFSVLIFLVGCSDTCVKTNTFEYDVLGASQSSNIVSKKAFSQPKPNMTNSEKDRFILGKSFFSIPWVEAPAATTARDGLGPLFSANTCLSCHPNNGAGVPLNSDGSIHRSLVMRLSNGNQAFDTVYGAQLSLNGTKEVRYEGTPKVIYHDKIIFYHDKSSDTLHDPSYSIDNLNYGELNATIAPRIALGLLGLGQLEKISKEDILAHEDYHDENGDGITGRVHYVHDIETNKTAIGRFTWKASAPTVKQQVAAAASNDMGLTSVFFPNENCTSLQQECLDAPRGYHTFDIPMKRLNAITFYTKSLAVPNQRDSKNVYGGAKLFKALNCVGCHVESYTLDSKEIIHPFTDLLLHDMGNGLSDGRIEGNASAQEWRTPPLWGVGLRKIVSGKKSYLHDGRAQTLEEAILWHGGEAKASQNAFLALDKKDRVELIKFLESL
jgi:CxxC motif-containing protein (DUF1111 family)